MPHASVQFASSDAGWSSLAARRAHNPKVVGSNPTPATKHHGKPAGVSHAGFFHWMAAVAAGCYVRSAIETITESLGLFICSARGFTTDKGLPACPTDRGESVMGSERNQRYYSPLAGCASGQGVRSRGNPGFEEVEMATYILLGGGFGLALAIAIWGIWKLR